LLGDINNEHPFLGTQLNPTIVGRGKVVEQKNTAQEKPTKQA
jgi:hypothetical protein